MTAPAWGPRDGKVNIDIQRSYPEGGITPITTACPAVGMVAQDLGIRSELFANSRLNTATEAPDPGPAIRHGGLP
jgi:hypothetical protein